MANAYTCVGCGAAARRRPGPGAPAQYCSFCQPLRTRFAAWRSGRGPHPLRWDVAYRTCEWCSRHYACHHRPHRTPRYCSSECERAWNAAPKTCAVARCQDCRCWLAGRAHGARYCPTCVEVRRSQRLEYERVRERMPHRRALRTIQRTKRQLANAEGRAISGVSVTVEWLAERDGSECWLCGEPVEMSVRNTRRGPSIDHIVPVSEGGLTTPENCRLAHQRCNAVRGTGRSEVVQLALLV